MVKKAWGSNQYKTKISVAVLLQEQDLMTQAAAQAVDETDRCRCGEVWGTECKAWVFPPDYSHDQHGLRGTLTKLADNPNCPPWAMQVLAESQQVKVRVNIAANLRCPPDILERLVQDPEPTVRRTAVYNPGCPPEGLWTIARSANRSDKINMLSYRESIPIDIIEYLSYDRSIVVSRLVARHPCSQPHILARLADSREDMLLYQILAINTNTDTATLTALLSSGDNKVVRNVLSNPNCPEEYKQLARICPH